MTIKHVGAAVLLLCTLTADAQSPINRQQAEAMAQQEVAAVFTRLQPAAQKVWTDKILQYGNYTVPFEYKVFGEKPAEGRSLYISMHGGGNGSAGMNDQQWRNQIKLYTPAEGVYLVPRAPTNTWNLWHEQHIDDVMDSLIRYAIVMEGVNPNKVYIMGYSAGGDGTFQLAPRMADRWAAASMMAGHPGDANALNLRNLPFAIYMGGKDAAYNRNGLAKVWQEKLDSLQKQDPTGFIHDVHIYEDKAHWMEKRDTIALPWMASFKRDPLPNKVIWVQDDRTQSHFYWLSTPITATKTGDMAEVTIKGNEITIQQNTFGELQINLNDQLVNLDKKITIIQNGKKLFSGKVSRSEAVIKKTVAQYQDASLVFSVRILIKEGKATLAL